MDTSSIWRVGTLLALALAAVGAVLPGLPSVPFLLLGAAAAHRGWPAMDARLLAHPRHGPLIRRWRQRRAVPRPAKYAASAMMGVSAALAWIGPLPLLLKIPLTLLMAAVAAWLWSRPDE